jgi:hypothetical protein
LVTDPGSLGLLDGTTSLVSRDWGRYFCGTLVEFDPPSGRLSGVNAGKTMNDRRGLELLGKEEGQGWVFKQQSPRKERMK